MLTAKSMFLMMVVMQAQRDLSYLQADMDSPKALVQVKRELEALGYTLESFAEAMGQAIRDIG